MPTLEIRHPPPDSDIDFMFAYIMLLRIIYCIMHRRQNEVH